VSSLRVHFIRHGDAERSAEGGDANRSLTAQGRRQSRAVATLLAEQDLLIDLIYCSPLVRAIQTTEIFVASLGCEDAVQVQPVIAYPSGLADILTLVDQCPTITVGLAVIGHEPTLSGLVTHLLHSTHPKSTWRGFYPSQVVAFDYERSSKTWTFQWQILPDGPARLDAIQ
jgi:phosphohistidine phosphatase